MAWGAFGTRGAPFADYAFTPAAPEKESDATLTSWACVRRSANRVSS